MLTFTTCGIPATRWPVRLGSLRELMDRMGHSTTRAALIYQHRTSLRDKMIADEISRRAEAERPQSGTQRARSNDEAS